MRCTGFVPSAVLSILMGTCVCAQTKHKSQSQEQTEFGAEAGHPLRPVKIPEAVLQTLRSLDNASPDEMPEESLVGSEIHLDGRDEIDLIVMGVGNLSLPHAAPFWVFRENQGQYELILTTGGDALTVLDARWKGYREIRVRNHTAKTLTATVYKFDGQRHRESNQEHLPFAKPNPQ
jgi:hypothetical protein